MRKKYLFIYLFFILQFFYESFTEAREFYISYSQFYRKMFSSEVDFLVDDREINASGVRVGGEIIKNLVLEVEYMRMSNSEWIYLFNDYKANFNAHWISGSLRYGYEFFGFTEPYGKVGLGYTLGTYRLLIGGYEYSDFSTSPHIYGAGGVEFFIPKRFFWAEDSKSIFRDLTAGIAIECGYIYELALNFKDIKSSKSSKPSDELDDIKVSNINFGSTSLSGLFFKIMVIVHF